MALNIFGRCNLVTHGSSQIIRTNTLNLRSDASLSQLNNTILKTDAVSSHKERCRGAGFNERSQMFLNKTLKLGDASTKPPFPSFPSCTSNSLRKPLQKCTIDGRTQHQLLHLLAVAGQLEGERKQVGGLPLGKQDQMRYKIQYT